ncbi:hypothetical protein Tco_0673123 [Tanacetum coccineum]
MMMFLPSRKDHDCCCCGPMLLLTLRLLLRTQITNDMQDGAESSVVASVGGDAPPQDVMSGFERRDSTRLASFVGTAAGDARESLTFQGRQDQSDWSNRVEKDRGLRDSNDKDFRGQIRGFTVGNVNDRQGFWQFKKEFLTEICLPTSLYYMWKGLTHVFVIRLTGGCFTCGVTQQKGGRMSPSEAEANKPTDFALDLPPYYRKRGIIMLTTRDQEAKTFRILCISWFTTPLKSVKLSLCYEGSYLILVGYSKVFLLRYGHILESPKLKNLSVVREYADVYSYDFRDFPRRLERLNLALINFLLLSVAEPISKAPYRMAPVELKS